MKLFWPVRIEDGAYLGQRFGEHLLDYTQFGVIGHPGLDYLFKDPIGKPIYAPHNGYIEHVNNDPSSSLGNYVIIWFEEDGFQWDVSLGHMIKTNFLTVDVGFSKQYPIRAGQIIGWVGSTGFSTGPHTHEALRQFKNGILLNGDNGYKGCLDPMKYLADEKEKPNMVLGYKRVGQSTVYVELSGQLIPLADWPAFVALGGSNDSVVELSEEQWVKFTKINNVLFKSL